MCTETVGLLECLARVLVHTPDKGHIATWYHRWHANRLRGMRDKAAPAGGLRSRGRSSRWTRWRARHGAMRIVACIMQATVIDQIFTHRRTRANREAQRRARGRAEKPPTGVDAAGDRSRRFAHLD